MKTTEDVQPGTKLILKSLMQPGEELRLTVPKGVPPGSTLTLAKDPETMAWKCKLHRHSEALPPASLEYTEVLPNTPVLRMEVGRALGPTAFDPTAVVMTTQIPEDAQPGTKFLCKSKEGVQLSLTVPEAPEGVPPGGIVEITQNPEDKSWCCTLSHG